MLAALAPASARGLSAIAGFPPEQAQVHRAYFGSVIVGRAERQLSCFVMTLYWSRALYLEFSFDQTTENFLRGHVHAFQNWSGAPRECVYRGLFAWKYW